jgi:hypothetical protein
LDDKAATIFTHVGVAVAILTLGSTAGAAAGHLGPWPILAAVPAVGLALAALFLAVLARRVVDRPFPGRIANAVVYAEAFGEKGEAAYIGAWEEATTGMLPVIRKKAGLVNRSVCLFALSVAFLTLPLGVVLVRKLMGLPV